MKEAVSFQIQSVGRVHCTLAVMRTHSLVLALFEIYNTLEFLFSFFNFLPQLHEN